MRMREKLARPASLVGTATGLVQVGGQAPHVGPRHTLVVPDGT